MVSLSRGTTVNTQKNSDGTFELSQLHLAEKIINRVGITLSMILKSSETPSGKLLLYKEKYILGRECMYNHREEVGMLSYLNGHTLPEIPIYAHQCERFCNNLHLVHKHAVRLIEKYLASTSTYVDFTYGN